MPFEKFPVYGSPEATLKLWSRKLEYLFANLDTDNVTSTSLLGTRSVKDTMIDFGTGLLQVDALNVPIVDSSSHFTSTSVEGALAEVGLHKDTASIHLAGLSTAISVALSTGLTGSTTLTVALALSSDLNKTNSLVNEIRLALINRGISS